MQRKGWYIVSYDIACPRRLLRVQRTIKGEGIAAQRSVFLVHGTEHDINDLLDRLAKMIVDREDDLRGYPIRDPADLWTSGPNPLAGFPLLYLDRETRCPPLSRFEQRILAKAKKGAELWRRLRSS